MTSNGGPDDTDPAVPSKMRRQATSSADWVEAATGSHSLTSAPPGVLRVYQTIGYYCVWLVRETWLQRKLILHWVAFSGGAAALSQHLWHWIR